MGTPYAEVIGDPIVQSKSPLIHRRWLAQAGLEGDFRATRVAAGELASYLADRRQDPDWRGCSVTIPHKQTVLPLLERIEPGARAIGAVNCIVRGPDGLIGRNTDIDGVASALGDTQVRGSKAVMIGAGGGARAAVHYLVEQGVEIVALVVRDPRKAAHLAGPRVGIHSFAACERAFDGASLIVNASPLGMAGWPAMPTHVLDCVAAHARGATLFDMVYTPLRTEFLEIGAANGGVTVDGLVMLVAQARSAFEAFFGRAAPLSDEALRDLIAR